MRNVNYIRAADGQLVTASEALDAAGVLKPGYGVKGSVMLRDADTAAQRVSTQRNARGETPSQAAYSKRISEAWKTTDPLPEQRPHAGGVVRPKPAPVGDAKPGVVSTSASQSAYEARVASAWRGG